VRSSIEYQERSGPASCPQCRDRCDAADLRLAPQLRAIAAAFAAARPLLLVRVRPQIPLFNLFAAPLRAHTVEHAAQPSATCLYTLLLSLRFRHSYKTRPSTLVF